MISRRLSAGLAMTMLMLGAAAHAQRHNAGVSPPTAPPRPQALVPMSSGLGPMQFANVDYGVPAPQSLTRQLQAEDDRTRAASLSAIGAPQQYLQRGHIPYPRSVELNFAPLGATDEQDAIVTAELDQHMVSAILIPEDGSWHRVATVVFPTGFTDPMSRPTEFLRMRRSLLQRGRYRAIFTAMTSTASGDYIENEAYVRVINNKAVVTMSFVSAARECDTATGRGHGGCDLTMRWLQPDTNNAGQHATMVSGAGKLSAREAADPMSRIREFEISRLRNFTCQPFAFNDVTQHYEPAAQPAPCSIPH